MSIKELFFLIKYVRKSKSCLVLKDNLVIAYFGERNKKLDFYQELIMKVHYEHHRKD